MAVQAFIPLVLRLLGGAAASGRGIAALSGLSGGSATAASFLGRAAAARALPESEAELNQLVVRHLGGGNAGGGANLRINVNGPQAPAHNLSSLAASPQNFARLLSGAASPGQIRSEDLSDRMASERSRQLRDINDAEQKFTKGLISSAIALTGLGLAATKEVTAFEGHARNILSGRQELEKFNGQISQAFARLRQSDWQARRELGERVAGTTAFLADSIAGLDRSTRDLQAAAATTANLFGIGLTMVGRGVSEIAKSNFTLSFIMQKLKDLEDGLRQDQGGPWNNFISDLGNGNFSHKERDRHTPMRRQQ